MAGVPTGKQACPKTVLAHHSPKGDGGSPQDATQPSGKGKENRNRHHRPGTWRAEPPIKPPRPETAAVYPRRENIRRGKSNGSSDLKTPSSPASNRSLTSENATPATRIPRRHKKGHTRLPPKRVEVPDAPRPRIIPGKCSPSASPRPCPWSSAHSPP